MPSNSSFNMGYVGRRGTTRASMARLDARLQQSFLGRTLRTGVYESMGFPREHGAFLRGPKGRPDFLGLHTSMQEVRAGQTVKAFGKEAQNIGRGVMSPRGMASMAGKTLFRSLGLLSTAYFAYTGYQEGGALGAVAGVGESIAWSAGIYALGQALPFAAPVAIGAAIAGGTYALGEAGRRHHKGLRNLELGGAQIAQALQTGSIATQRQRSLMALQNTHINGRMSMGNEAMMLHVPFL